MLKICNECNEEKDVSLFPKIGKLCKSCKARKLRQYRASDPDQKKKRKIYRQNNKEKIRQQKKESYYRNANKVKKCNNDYYHNNADRCKKRQREYQARVETTDIKSWLTKCMKHSKASDKKLGREFDLDIEFLLNLFKLQNGRCAISNVPMKHERKNLFSASIDRINQTIGHTKTNVQLVCQAINLAKRNYSNQHISDFMAMAQTEMGNIEILDFKDFSYPESTYDYVESKKQLVIRKLRKLCQKDFVPPSYNKDILDEDLERINEYELADYFDGKNWRSHKPESKTFAGKRIIWHYQQHLWDVRTQNKPLISEVWGKSKIFEKALINLVNGKTKISLDRIIRELVFAGAGVPSQIHPGFAKAILLYFGCKSGDQLYDPFAGWGGRLLAAQSIGAHYNACEMSTPTYNGLIKMANKNSIIKNINCFEDEIPNADIMFTSPPFGTEEYIGSDHSVDINNLIEITDHIPVRILHLNNYLAESIKSDNIICVNAKTRASSRISTECLVVLKHKG